MLQNIPYRHLAFLFRIDDASRSKIKGSRVQDKQENIEERKKKKNVKGTEDWGCLLTVLDIVHP